MYDTEESPLQDASGPINVGEWEGRLCKETNHQSSTVTGIRGCLMMERNLLSKSKQSRMASTGTGRMLS